MFRCLNKMCLDIRQRRKAYLNNSWVLRQVAGSFGGLTNSQVLYITSSKDDVLKYFISGWNWSVSGSIFST